MTKTSWIAALPLLFVLAACGQKPDSGEDGAVSRDRLVAANTDTDSWMSGGRTYDEQRHSPLTQINDTNVSKLGLAWYSDLDTARGQEATPLVIDGIIYVSTAWSMVKAFDGSTGKLLWSYDPEVPKETLSKACCDAVNRGVAAWGDRLFVGTLDGRLIAINRNTGKPDWSVATVDTKQNYTITGAPRVINGKVIIGNSGAELGARGYVSAYDVRDGSQIWRFYTVPGNPKDGFENEAMERAAKTWKGEWWKNGGGGTVWDSMAYDPELDLLYIGVGNGSPWNQAYRSPGGGDNLYLSSIVALKPETGEYVWHYQTTPGETWDYTATQHIMLADLKIDGKVRKVLMQAPKNGFFYVLDRATGKFISAKPYTRMNWAIGIDPKTGRPIENPKARYDKTGEPFLVIPGPSGGHSWQPMSFDPKAGLVYIPVIDAGFPYVPDKNWKKAEMGYNVGIDFSAAAVPADKAIQAAAKADTKGALVAWDPVNQVEKWRVPYDGPWNGGLLATAGNLVFQGTADGRFLAYQSGTGKELWSTNAQTGVLAAPVSYSIGGEQYIAVLVGWGGSWALSPGLLSSDSGVVRNVSRLLVFKLGGTAQLPALQAWTETPLDPPPSQGTAEQIAEGGYLFGRNCASCHGGGAVGGTIVPDLRRSAALENRDTWKQIVIEGLLKDNGMVAWNKVLSPQQADNIRHFVIKRAHEDRALEGGATKPKK